MYASEVISPSHNSLGSRSLSAALVLLLGLVMPSVANACNLCADAASRVTQPGVLDAGRVLFLFFMASGVLLIIGRFSKAEWRLGSKLYWLVGVAVVVGGVWAATTGLTLAAGPLLLVLSLMRIYRASKLPSPSSRELLATLLAGLFVVAGPTAFLVGNQRASNLDYLFSSLGAGQPVTVKEALKALQAKDEAAAAACDRLGDLKARNTDLHQSRPMELLALTRLAEDKGGCPDDVLYVQRVCAFPAEAKMDGNLSCAGGPKD